MGLLGCSNRIFWFYVFWRYNVAPPCLYASNRTIQHSAPQNSFVPLTHPHVNIFNFSSTGMFPPRLWVVSQTTVTLLFFHSHRSHLMRFREGSPTRGLTQRENYQTTGQGTEHATYVAGQQQQRTVSRRSR